MIHYEISCNCGAKLFCSPWRCYYSVALNCRSDYAKTTLEWFPKIVPPHNASIVIATHNRLEFLPPLIRSLQASVGSAEPEIILVDGGSTDGTVDALRGAFPAIRILEHSENLGPSASRNEGSQAATGDFLFFSIQTAK